MFREVYEIDKDGYVIDNYLMTEEQIEEATASGRIFVSGWYTESFYKPRYDFSTQSWIEEMTVEEILEGNKARKIEELNSVCEAETLQPFQASNGHLYEFDYKDQSNFNQQLSFLVLDPSINEIIWKTVDAGVIMHTRDEFIQVCKDAEEYKRGNISKNWQLKGLVNSATSLEEVELINWY